MRKFLMLMFLIPFIGFTQAPNDLCLNATAITDFGCFDGNNFDAEDDLASCIGCQLPNCGRHDEVWYTFVPSSTNQSYSLSSTDLPYIEILLYDACGGTLLHDNCGTPTIDGVFTSLTIGNTYYMAISSEDNDEGVFNICLGTALPVELTSFWGRDIGKENHIHWTTASESDNDYFTLEKSESGYVWNEIARIDGAGNSSIELNYKFIDSTPAVSYTYYRLTQTDFNGNSRIYDEISVENRSTVFYTYTTIPKDGFIYLSSSYEYEFINAMGQKVSYGYNDRIDTRSFPQGIYILRVGGYTKKFYLQ